MKLPLFYRQQPVFGFDLGYNSIKAMQIEPDNKTTSRVTGYAYTTFDPKAINDGVIVDPETVAKEAFDMVSKHVVGRLNTKRVAAAIPIAQAYNRVLTMPAEKLEDVKVAVQVEVQQYIPIPIEDLYYDFDIGSLNDKDGEVEVLIMASPKRVIDSYVQLFELLGLELAALETSISSSTRLVMHAEGSDLPTLIIDFGSVTTDLSIYDTTLRVTGTVKGGGDTITEAVAKNLKVTKHQAHIIKTKHGLHPSKYQKKMQAAITPLLDSLAAEIKKMIRFYQERTGKERTLEQVIILGGGANMPGMTDFLTDHIRVPTRMCNPWLNLDFGDLQPPHQLEKTLYATAAGLALIKPEDL